METNEALKQARSIAEFKQAMTADGDDYFEPRHFNKVDVAYEVFRQDLQWFGLKITMEQKGAY